MNRTNNETIVTDHTVNDTVSCWIWRISAPILFIVGMIGNYGIMLVMYRMKFWKRQTLVFLFILAVSDTVVICAGLSREWIEALLMYDIRNASDIGCKLHVFIIYFSMHVSSWTLVCITFERFLKTRDPFRDKCLSVSKNVNIAYCVSLVVCVGIDVPLIVTNGLILTENGQICNNTSNDYYIYEEKYFVFIDLVWLSLLPFTLMLVMNFFVGRTILNSFRKNIHSIPHRESRVRRRRSNATLTVMLFVTSMYFIAATLPISILFIVDSFLGSTASKQAKSSLSIIKACFYVLQFSNYVVNFYIFIKFKPSFRRYLYLSCLSENSQLSQRKLSQTSQISTIYTSQTEVETDVSNDVQSLAQDQTTGMQSSRLFDTSKICRSQRNINITCDVGIVLNSDLAIDRSNNNNMQISDIHLVSAVVTGITIESKLNKERYKTDKPPIVDSTYL